MDTPPRSTLLKLGLAVLLVAPLLALALPNAEATTTSRVLAITGALAKPLVPFKAFDGDPPKVFDVNGDGQLEIIAQNDNQWVYVFDSKTGAILYQVKTTFPTGWGARSINGPEVAILKQGGTAHLIVANSAAYITSFRFDPVNSVSTQFVFVKEWERRLNDCFSNPGMDSKPVFADLDKDGQFEILGLTEEFGIYALRADGTLLWKNCLGGGNAEPDVGDLNMDGWPDVVMGDDGGTISALDGRTGTKMWSYYLLSHFNLGSGSMPVGVTVGQVDGKLGPDVVVGARDSHDPDNWSNDHALLVALDSQGKLLWGRQDTNGGAPLTYTHAVIADTDNNGQPEIYWADWNTIGHKPPYDEALAWQPTGPAHFYRYDPLGNLVWKQTLGTWWNNKDIPIADVDGDGIQEMLANGPNTNGHDGIWYLDTRTGAKETFVDVFPWQVQRAPVVADLWKTGTMQWVLQAAAADASAGGPAVLVYDTRAPYSAAWPHLPYPTVGAAPPPPSGYFGATFTIKSPNEWWQELSVTPQGSHTITSASVRIDNGAWLAMSKSSWGAWTSSYHSVAGSQVEFLVKDTANMASQSLPFTWMDGTLSRGSSSTSPTPSSTTTPPTSTPPPTPTTTSPAPTPTTTVPPGTFTASFQLGNVNNYWVETSVTANQPLSLVEAKAGSGAWTALTKQSWGAWAKSFYVATCTPVQFRATSSTGATALSGTYAWLDTGSCGSSSFTATFDPRAVGNDWWLEVAVSANHPLSKVEAVVTSGSTTTVTPLALQSWGSWAKSVYVPDGSTVVFRATDTSNNSVSSAAVIWT